MEDKILHELKYAKDYVSGEHLSSILNVSRTSIWKHMKSLKAKGYVIDGISNKGYKLISCPDSLTAIEISPLIKTVKIGKNIIHYDNIDSTNIKAKELAKNGADDGTIVISEEQSLSSGRLNRIWKSPKGGIWFTIILKPNIPPLEASKITQIAAAAVYKTLNDFDISTNIKWPNDILLNNKKICGILTEMKCDMDRIHYLVVGIGMNINIDSTSFDENLRLIATSLKIEYKKHFDRKEILSTFLTHFEKLYDDFINSFDLSETINICRENSNLFGKQAKLITYNNEEIVTCISLSDSGNLIVKDSSGNEKIVVTGEISFSALNE